MTYRIWEALGEKNAAGIPQDLFQGTEPNINDRVGVGTLSKAV